ncbi:hypothetical protein EGW08_017711 [Elysia chlorotica]|uniref:Uncharacterized protein n=1 Tax=Elysia chlorotica TaxID=188477 RepID=A0A433SYY4_ELYCH|nr:hypothetical protein EGW08_017711 [Elysia chlorotica]
MEWSVVMFGLFLAAFACVSTASNENPSDSGLVTAGSLFKETNEHSNSQAPASTHKDYDTAGLSSSKTLQTINEEENSSSVDKRRLDSIASGGSFTGFGKRNSPGEVDDEFVEKPWLNKISSNRAFQAFGKRRLDSIGSNSAFQGFGKRRLDSIGGNSAFQGFGKRRLDSIGGNSAFQGFGKRRLDSIGGNSAFQGFGKRRLDSIGGNSAFQGFGKRRLDSIGGNSAFQGFGKRRLDSIGSNSAFQGFGKRRLDSIEGNGAFQGFGKRDIELNESEGERDIQSRRKRATESNDGPRDTQVSVAKRSVSEGDITLSLFKPSDDAREHNSSPFKRRLDSIAGGFRQFGKRHPGILDDDIFRGQIDSDDVESGDGDFNDLGSPYGVVRKRRFDRISNGVRGFGSFGKRNLNSVDYGSSLASPGFSKRRFDTLSSSSSFFSPFNKRRLDRISAVNRFRSFGKRRFDRIDGKNCFWKFGKRNVGREDSIDSSSDSSSSLTDALLKQLTQDLTLLLADSKTSATTSLAPLSSQQQQQQQQKNHLPGLRSASLLQKSSSTDLMEFQHLLDDPVFNRYASLMSSPEVAKRRFDSIDRFSLFRRFGRGGRTTVHDNPQAGFLNPTWFHVHNDNTLVDTTILKNFLNFGYPNLFKVLYTGPSKVSDKEIQRAFFDLIDLISQDKKNSS